MSLRAAQAREHIRRMNSTGSLSGPDGPRPTAAPARSRQAAPPPRVAARQADLRATGCIAEASCEKNGSISTRPERRRPTSVSRERSRSTSVGSERAQQQSTRCTRRTKSPLSSSRAGIGSAASAADLDASAYAIGPVVPVQRSRGSRSSSREPQTLGRRQGLGSGCRGGGKERLTLAAAQRHARETNGGRSPAVSSRQAPPRDKHDHADLVKLRAALEETHCQIEETLLEVSVQQWRVKESKVQQQEEIAHLSEILESLDEENRRLQSAARGGRSATWRLQAQLRSQEESIQSKTEELSERQKRLAQENVRLRKEAAAMKSRLLGWRQLQKRNVNPSRRAPLVKSAPMPLSSEASTASTARSLQLSTACSTEAPPSARPSSPTPPMTLPGSRRASEDGSADAQGEVEEHMTCLFEKSTLELHEKLERSRIQESERKVEEQQARLLVLEESHCEEEAREVLLDSTPDSMPGSGTTEPCNSKSPRWRTISAVAADSVGITLSESLLRQHRAEAPPWHLEDLTPAAREAAEVSAMVRVRAQEALRGQGLHDGESGGSSAGRSRSASVYDAMSACSRSGKGSPRTPQTCATPSSWQIAWRAGWPPSNGLSSWATGGSWTSNSRQLFGKVSDEEVSSEVALASPEHSFRDATPGMGFEYRQHGNSDFNLGSS